MKFFSVAIATTLIAALSVSANQCSKSQFPHSGPRTGDCCLPSGGQPNPPSPPPSKSCPSEWQWHSGFECCVPTKPNPPSNPSCPKGTWDHDNQCCNHPTPPSPPTPSGGVNHHYKRSNPAKISSRNWRAKTVSCPMEQTICNVSDGLTKSNTWACVDTKKDVNFCGGCGARGDGGVDCSSIPNSWNVGCDAGECRVFTCEPGFRVSHHGKGCVALD